MQEEKTPTQPPAPPIPSATVELGDAPQGSPVAHAELSAASPESLTAVAPAPVNQTIHPADDQSFGARMGRWAHSHPSFTKAPLSYLGYQFFRATMATIPYGAMMALGNHAFTYMSAVGQKMGLTADGIQAFEKAVSEKKGGLGAADVEKFYKEFNSATNTLGKRQLKPVLGRTMMRLGNSPLNPAVQIALGFTLFRFTGGIVKNLRDRIFNDKNTEAETIHETKTWWQTVKETARTNWAAESGSTPIAALVLGFMNAAFVPSPEGTPVRNKALYPGLKGFWTQLKEIWSPKAKLAQNAGVWTASYSAFFLLAECLFKDIQIRRGLGQGQPTRLKNGPDDITGGPGAVHYTPPEERIATMIAQSAEQGYAPIATKPDATANKDKSADHAADSQHVLRYPILTGEPSIGRFLLRRVAPVAVGISAYAALKRLGYLAVGGPMKAVLPKDLGKGFAHHIRHYGVNYWREAVATTMFGALWASTDLGTQWYDKFFEKLQKPENAVPLTPEQQKNHAELLDRLTAREKTSDTVSQQLVGKGANDNGSNDNNAIKKGEKGRHTAMLANQDHHEIAAGRA